MGALIVLLLGLTVGPSIQAPSKGFRLGRVISSRYLPDGMPTMEWAPGEKSLAILYRASKKGNTLAVWPEMDAVSLNFDSGDGYVHWSPDGKQILVGDHDDVYLLERRRMRVLKHLTHITDAGWEHGRVRFHPGEPPKDDYLPGTAGGSPKPVGTVFPLTTDEGAGRLKAVVTKAGYDIQYLGRSAASPGLSVGKMFDEENYDSFFCVADGDRAYIGVPMRSMDAAELWVYKNGRVEEVDFSHWKRAGPGKGEPLGFVGVTIKPVRIGRRLIGFGQRFGEEVVASKSPGSVLLDFTSKTIYHTAQNFLAMAGSRSGRCGAVVMGDPADMVSGISCGELYLISGR